MMEEVSTLADRLSEVIENMKKCLECTICLHTISDPVKTICGHRFCRACIQTVLQNNKALCPLCNTTIQRRNITKDQHMVQYIQQLQNLIQAIQADSGIDILSHLRRPRGIEKTYSSNSIEFFKTDSDLILPSCSYDDTVSKKPVAPRSYRAAAKQKKSTKSTKGKKKNESKEGNDITKFLSKCVSCVEPFPPDQANDSKEDKSAEEKVHSWLQNLPDNEELEIPDGIKPYEPMDSFLNDTMPISVSQNCPNNNLENINPGNEVEADASCFLTGQNLANSPRKDNVESKLKNGGRSRKNSTTVKGNERNTSVEIGKSKENVTETTKSRENSRERSQGKPSDIQKASPSDLLPTMKKNWSSVKEFGKELRTKKKKLKSLNVSIEATGKSRLKSEPMASTGEEKMVESKLSDETIDKRTDDDEINTFERVTKKSFQETETSPEKMDICEQASFNSSFIMLQEGENIHIRNLNSSQMNDIIGISQGDLQLKNDNKIDTNKKQNDLSGVQLQDKSKEPRETPPMKATEKQNSTSMNVDVEKKDNTLNLQSEVCQIQKKNSGIIKVSQEKSFETTKRFPAVCSDFPERRERTSTIVFKKLGRVCKHQKKRVSFLYLGSTNRMSLRVRTLSSLAIQKPCNPVDILDTQALEGFGKNILITVNDTPAMEEPERSNSRKENMEIVSETKKLSNDETVVEKNSSKKLGETVEGVHSKSQESDVLLFSMPTSREIFNPPQVSRMESLKKPAKANAIKMLSPTKDSQLQFLSLESPGIENVPIQWSIDRFGTSKNTEPLEIKETRSNARARSSEQALLSSEYVSTPQKRPKWSKSDQTFQEKISEEYKEDKVENDDCLSDRSLSLQATCINVFDRDQFLIDKGNSAKFGSASTKDIETISLSSETDVMLNDDEGQRKVYKRIISFDDSPTIPATKKFPNKRSDFFSLKRKRSDSSDSDVEADLNTIADNWYAEAKPGERFKKKERLDEPMCSMKVSPKTEKRMEWRNNSRSDQEDDSKKRNSGKIDEKFKSEASVMLVNDEDESPNFTAVIDKIKDLQNKTIVCDGKQNEESMEQLLRDNFDEIIASVVLEAPINDSCNNEGNKPETKSIERLEKSSHLCGNSPVKVFTLDKNNSLLTSPSCSDKENIYKSGPLYDDDDDNDRTMISKHSTEAKKNLDKDKFREKLKDIRSKNETTAMMGSQSRKTFVRNSVLLSDGNKLQVNENPNNDSTDKDSTEQDSLLDITQHYLMIKQFEEDLFGKPKTSNIDSKSEQLIEHQTPRKEKKEDPGVNKDVEHSSEEDDIVENTPNTKQTNYFQSNRHQTTDSSKNRSITPMPVDMFEDEFSNKSVPSTVINYEASNDSPLHDQILNPVCQSTPKTRRVTSEINDNIVKSISVADALIGRQKRNLTENNVQNVQKSIAEKLCFICSSLSPAQIELVKELCRLTNVKYLSQFELEVTHVIVKTDEDNNGANKTLKYLQGVAHRKWIVSYQWVLDSLKEQKLMNEERYEAVDLRTLQPGPRNSRLREKDLFEDFAFFCIGPYTDIAVPQYQDLLRATGGIVVDSLPALAAEKKRFKIIVVAVDAHGDKVIEWYKKTRAVPIAYDWVVECISQYKLISFYSYLLELLREDVLALGYPEFLVEDDPDVESDESDDETT